MINIKKLGETQGYSFEHYKNCIERLVSFFTPELKAITDKMEATEAAKFLMKTAIPATEYETMTAQMGNIIRQPGIPIKAILTRLEGIGRAYYAEKPEGERSSLINKFMLQGILSFTEGQTKLRVENAMNLANRKGRTLQWTEILDTVVDSETVHGSPRIPLQFQQNVRNTIDLYHSTYSPVSNPVDTSINPVTWPLDPSYSFSTSQPDYNNQAYQPAYSRNTKHHYTPSVNLPARPHVPRPITHNIPPPPPPPAHEVEQDALAALPFYPPPPPPNQPPATPNRPRPKQEPVTPRDEERRRPSRERRQTPQYDAATGITIHYTSTNNDRSPSSSYRNRSYERNKNQTRNNDRYRSNSRDRNYRNNSRDNNYRHNSRDRYNRNYRNDSRDRNYRNNSKDRNYRNNSRENRYRNNRSASRSNQDAGKYRNKSADRYRNMSNDRRNNRYKSRSISNNRIETRQRERSKSPYERNRDRANNRSSRYDDRRNRSRSQSNNRNNKEANSGNRKYQDFLPGINAAAEYNPRDQKQCMKCCTRSDHHEFQCPIYFRVAARECKKCMKGYHYETDCQNARSRSSSVGNKKRENF